jgi:hypothetical protein
MTKRAWMAAGALGTGVVRVTWVGGAGAVGEGGGEYSSRHAALSPPLLT